MRNEVTKNFLFVGFSGILIFANLTLCIIAQSEKEKPRIKDFGSSLKSKKSDKSGEIKNEKSSEEDVLRVETAIVVSDVLILDEKGVAVKGLTAADLVVSENNVPQEIELFALGGDAKVSRSIVLLIDHSHSQLPFIVNSVMSAGILIDNLNPNDRVAIVTDNVELLCDFTRDRKLLKKKLETLKTRMVARRFGQSRQYSALHAVFNELFDDEDTRRIVIFQTDGDQINLDKKKFDMNGLTEATEKSRATIYSIFPGLRYENLSEDEKYRQAKAELKAIAERFSDKGTFDLKTKNISPERQAIVSYYEKTAEQQSVLKRFAESSGGWMEYLPTPVKANQIYSRILDEINNRYVVGYYPKNETRDDRRRTVKIQVKDHPEYKIEGHKTYFASETEK